MFLTDHWVLDDNGEPQPTRDIVAWANWHADIERRRVAWTKVALDAHVSTVFLGIDHNVHGHGPPILYETLVFGSSLDGEMERYATRLEAIAGHDQMVERVRAAETG